jgi:hypothetical protein
LGETTVRKILVVLRGRLLAESLRVEHDLRIAGLTVTRIGRHDVTASTIPGADDENRSGGAAGRQPTVWTFIDFEAPDDNADVLADALAVILEREDGWWADYVLKDVHYVVFADRVFRYWIGDSDARQEAVAYGIRAGTPRHQLDWGP